MTFSRYHPGGLGNNALEMQGISDSPTSQKLSPNKAKRVCDLLSQVVCIKSKEESFFEGRAQVFNLVHAFAKSFFAMQAFAFSDGMYIYDVTNVDTSHFSADLAIRGSLVSAILQELVSASDLDTVIKLPIDSSMFSQEQAGHHFDARSFCYAACLLALKSLFPEKLLDLCIEKKSSLIRLSFFLNMERKFEKL